MDGVKTFYGKIPIFLVLCLCAKICFSEVMEGPGFAVENGGSRTGVISRLFNMKRFVTNVDNPDLHNIQTNFDQKDLEGIIIEILYSLCLEIPVPVSEPIIDSVCNLIVLRKLSYKYNKN